MPGGRRAVLARQLWNPNSRLPLPEGCLARFIARQSVLIAPNVSRRQFFTPAWKNFQELF
jgi:hypothetical protein